MLERFNSVEYELKINAQSGTDRKPVLIRTYAIILRNTNKYVFALKIYDVHPHSTCVLIQNVRRRTFSNYDILRSGV